MLNSQELFLYASHGSIFGLIFRYFAIHSFILNIYIAPLQENYSKALLSYSEIMKSGSLSPH